MTFVSGLEAFARKAERNETAVFVRSVSDLRDSIKFGSALTGAPAMPVAVPKYPKAGSLRDSVHDRWSDPNNAVVLTTKWFAPLVEDDAQGHTFTSGGPHGWKMSHAAWQKIVEANAKRLAGGGA